jgi:histidinol-phosphate aminotransferase
MQHGIVLRRMEVYGLPNALRLTVGSEDANHAIVGALRTFLTGRRPSHG